MNNAELFKKVFGIYAEEFWALPTDKMTAWLVADAPTAEPRWIPCERELPELASYVLVSHVGSVFVDCLTMENGDLFFWETGVFLAEEIRNLAWMPLPKPWKGGAE